MKNSQGKTKWGDALRTLHDTVLSLLYPPACVICGAFIQKAAQGNDGGFPHYTKGFMQADVQTVFERSMARIICEDCLDTFQPVAAPYCIRCGTLFTSRKGENRMCGHCLDKQGRYRMARAAGCFQGVLMDVVHLLKYQGKLQLADPLSMVMLFAMMAYVHEFTGKEERIDTVVPVPLHPRRFRERGFNQAFLLVRHWEKWGRLYGVEIPVSDIDRHILYRNRHTDFQTGLGKEERRKNIRGAFSLSANADIRGKRLLLVDDVYTTGATVEECARVLIKGGARHVDVLTLARTV